MNILDFPLLNHLKNIYLQYQYCTIGLEIGGIKFSSRKNSTGVDIWIPVGSLGDLCILRCVTRMKDFLISTIGCVTGWKIIVQKDCLYEHQVSPPSFGLMELRIMAEVLHSVSQWQDGLGLEERVIVVYVIQTDSWENKNYFRRVYSFKSGTWHFLLYRWLVATHNLHPIGMLIAHS